MYIRNKGSGNNRPADKNKGVTLRTTGWDALGCRWYMLRKASAATVSKSKYGERTKAEDGNDGGGELTRDRHGITERIVRGIMPPQGLPSLRPLRFLFTERKRLHANPIFTRNSTADDKKWRLYNYIHICVYIWYNWIGAALLLISSRWLSSVAVYTRRLNAKS